MKKLVFVLMVTTLFIGLISNQVLAQEPMQCEGTYTVQAGDTLGGIADKCLNDPQTYPVLMVVANARPNDEFDDIYDPNLIEPDWTIGIPSGMTYTVQEEAVVGDLGIYTNTITGTRYVITYSVSSTNPNPYWADTQSISATQLVTVEISNFLDTAGDVVIARGGTQEQAISYIMKMCNGGIPFDPWLRETYRAFDSDPTLIGGEGVIDPSLSGIEGVLDFPQNSGFPTSCNFDWWGELGELCGGGACATTSGSEGDTITFEGVVEGNDCTTNELTITAEASGGKFKIHPTDDDKPIQLGVFHLT